MNYRICVFKYLEQKVMYLPDVNYYFGIKDVYDIKLGDYELSEEAILAIAKENDPEEYEVFINTNFEERLNKINTYNIEEIKEESSFGQFTLCLHPSRRCNLNCKYCFRDSEYLGDEQLTFEVAKDAIDFLVEQYAPCASKYVVDLSGSGEPLLQIDLVKRIVEYCKKRRNEICKNIEVMFCTNLTLLTPEVVEYLDNEPTIILGTSIDGDQITNDFNRVYDNGKGTYEDIVKGLKMFKHKKLGLAATITPLNQDVDLIFDNLYSLPNVDCVSLRLIRNNDGSEYDFENFNEKYLLSRYERLCQNIIKNIKNNNFDYLVKLVNGADVLGNLIAQNLFKGINIIYRCDAGKNRITINNKGDIYSCSVMMGNKEFKIGNIYCGVNNVLQSKYWDIQKKVHEVCSKCTFMHMCGGECYANSYLRYNDMKCIIEKNCRIIIGLNKISMAFIEYLKNDLNDIYDRLISFAFRIQNYSSMDSAIWAIMTFLKLKGIKPNYDVINSQLSISGVGVKPQDFVDYLKLYNLDINAYLLDSCDNVKPLKFPSISLANKKNISKYIYYVNIDGDGKDILFRSLETPNNSYDKTSIKDYVKNFSDIFFF